MTPPSSPTTPFSTEAQEVVQVSLTLPRQEPMDGYGSRQLAPAQLTILHRPDDQRAVDNALGLLHTLYSHGVTSPHVLQLILRATGQQQTSAPSAEAHTRCTESASSAQGQSALEGQ